MLKKRHAIFPHCAGCGEEITRERDIGIMAGRSPYCWACMKRLHIIPGAALSNSDKVRSEAVRVYHAHKRGTTNFEKNIHLSLHGPVVQARTGRYKK